MLNAGVFHGFVPSRFGPGCDLGLDWGQVRTGAGMSKPWCSPVRGCQKLFTMSSVVGALEPARLPVASVPAVDPSNRCVGVACGLLQRPDAAALPVHTVGSSARRGFACSASRLLDRVLLSVCRSPTEPRVHLLYRPGHYDILYLHPAPGPAGRPHASEIALYRIINLTFPAMLRLGTARDATTQSQTWSPDVQGRHTAQRPAGCRAACWRRAWAPARRPRPA